MQWSLGILHRIFTSGSSSKSHPCIINQVMLWFIIIIINHCFFCVKIFSSQNQELLWWLLFLFRFLQSCIPCCINEWLEPTVLFFTNKEHTSCFPILLECFPEVPYGIHLSKLDKKLLHNLIFSSFLSHQSLDLSQLINRNHELP